MKKVSFPRVFVKPEEDYRTIDYDPVTLAKLKIKAQERLSEKPDDLHHENHALKDDKDVVLVAVKGKPSTIRWASKRLREDADVIITSCSNADGSFRLLRFYGFLNNAKRPYRINLKQAIQNLDVCFRQKDQQFFKDAILSLDGQNIDGEQKSTFLYPVLPWVSKDILTDSQFLSSLKDLGIRNALKDELLRRNIDLIKNGDGVKKNNKRQRKGMTL